MAVADELRREARALPIAERQRILRDTPETEMHGYLAQLFRELSPDYTVVVTHGVGELGKDVVIVRSDPIAPDVVAVVVKRGDIKGKTMGDVDALKADVAEILTASGERITAELLSQIRQAKQHPAELGPSFERLQVTKVFVALVGEMSNNARTRLERELGSTGKILDFLWLVEEFTAHYPQVYFDGRAVDYLDSLLGLLERDTFYSKNGKTLSDCYVEPYVAPMDRSIAAGDDGATIQVLRKRAKLSQLVTMLAKGQNVLLVGDPGSGKSKALAKLCIDRYRAVIGELTRSAAAGEPYSIPVMLTARRLDEFQTSAALQDEFLPLAVRERFKLHSLLVDALDEVPAQERERVLAKCHEMARELGCALVVTTRKLTALSTTPKGFRRMELLPFELSQAIRLVEKASENRDTLPALRDGLRKIVTQIPMSPLSLLLLMEVVRDRKEVPSSTTELYDRFLDMVFGRWDQEKGLEVLFEYVVKKRFLAALAHDEFYSKNRLEIPAAEFDSFLSRFAAEYGWDEASLRSFMKEIERAGVLDVHEDVFFRHRSFLDYFVALHIFENRMSILNVHDAICTIYFDGRWTEVAFFYAGLGRQVPRDLAEKLLRFGPDSSSFPMEKMLVGRLLQAGWFSPTADKLTALRACLEYIEPSRAEFHSIVAGIDPASPLLYSDVFAMVLSELGFGSVFLSNETQQLLAELESVGPTDAAGLLKRMALVWAARRFLSDAEYSKRLKALVSDVENSQLSASHEARFLLLGMLAEPANGKVRAIAERRLRRLNRKAPGLLKPILPPKKPGFRSGKKP